MLNPDQINHRQKSWSMNQIVGMIHVGGVVSTELSDEARARSADVIESGLLALPSLVFFIENIRTGLLFPFDRRTGEIIQTYCDFFADRLPIAGLVYFTELEGKRFSELPHHLRRRLERSEQMSVFVFEQTGENKEEMLDIARRLTR